MARDRFQPAHDRAPGADRRSAPRLDKVFPVFIEGERGEAMGVARNISEGGMFVETRSPEALGSQVRITFPSDGGEMAAIAEVRYVCHLLGRATHATARPAAVRGMGVRFLYFDAEGATPRVVH